MKAQYVFGKDDILAVPKPEARLGVLSITTAYANPSLDAFYSSVGFAYPLQNNQLPLDVVVRNLFPIEADHLKPAFAAARYLLVDHFSNVWRVLVQDDVVDKTKDRLITYEIIHTKSGWWVTSGLNPDSADTGLDLMLGLLSNDPKPEVINNFWSKHATGQDLVWLNIPEIVKKLEKEHPDPMMRNHQLRNSLKRSSMAIMDEVLKQRYPDPPPPPKPTERKPF